MLADAKFPTYSAWSGTPHGIRSPGVDLTPHDQRKLALLDREGVLLEFVAETRPDAAFFDETCRAFRSRRYKYHVLAAAHGCPG